MTAQKATDDFFQKAGLEGVIQVFDFDYEAVVSFETEKANCGLLWCPLCWPFAPCHFMGTLPNIKDDVHCQHAALTRDGILYVRDKHKKGCRCDCDMAGKVSKTVPYDKLTDCDIEEPAGEDCCVKRSLYIVNVDTASGNRGEEGSAHELTLVGLKDPNTFKSMVWQLKRGEHPECRPLGAPSQMGMAPTTFGSSSNEEVVSLLKRNNELLEQIEVNTRK